MAGGRMGQDVKPGYPGSEGSRNPGLVRKGTLFGEKVHGVDLNTCREGGGVEASKRPYRG